MKLEIIKQCETMGYTRTASSVPNRDDLIEIKIPNEESVRCKVKTVEHVFSEDEHYVRIWVKGL